MEQPKKTYLTNSVLKDFEFPKDAPYGFVRLVLAILAYLEISQDKEIINIRENS